jgi:hypothetical protein
MVVLIGLAQLTTRVTSTCEEVHIKEDKLDAPGGQDIQKK